MTLKRRPTGVPRTFETLPAGKAVARALDLHGLGNEVRAGRLLTEWSDLVGPKIAQRTRPGDVVARTLWIEVATAAWMHELNTLRPQLLAGLLARFGEPRVFDEIKFKLAGRSRREPVSLRAKRPPPPPAKPMPAPASGVAREAIVREASGIEDDELRELVARIRITHDR